MDLTNFHQLDIVLICGIPGSGKSHFAKAHFHNKSRKRINRKEIRRHIYEMTSFGNKWKDEYFDEEGESLVKHVERKMYEQFLQNMDKVLIDNPSVKKSSRKNYLSLAEQRVKTTGVIFLNTPLMKCMERNQKREDAVPDKVISTLYSSIELPDKHEGFDEILVISDY